MLKVEQMFRKALLSTVQSPRLALAAIVATAFVLRIWRLDQNGFGAEYYSAAVQSMLQGWHNFFFNSFDPAGFISLDKPPLAFWVQVISAKIFGFNGMSVLMPQVLEGIATILLAFHLVRRRFGVPAALLTSLFLAIMPVSVAVDRSSIPESCLVLLLMLSAWALTVAAERGSMRLLLLSMALVGLAFNVKLLAAFVVVPIFLAIYFAGAPIPAWRRLVHLSVAAVVLGAVSLWWLTAYDLTPPESRPYAAKSVHNSMFELAFSTYGLNILQDSKTKVSPLENRRRKLASTSPTSTDPIDQRDQSPTAGRSSATPSVTVTDANQVPKASAGRSRNPFFDDVPVGPLRLAEPHLAGQVAWLFPLALIGLLTVFLLDKLSWPVTQPHLSLLLWSGWALTYAIVFSYDTDTFHGYYLVTVAPVLAMLAGVGIVRLWSLHCARGWPRLLLPAALLMTAAWQAYIEFESMGPMLGRGLNASSRFSALLQQLGEWWVWLFFALLGGALFSVAGLLLARPRNTSSSGVSPLNRLAIGSGLVVLLVMPTVWALSNVLVRVDTIVPSADISRLAGITRNPWERYSPGFGVATDDPKLFNFLSNNHRGERFVLATPNAWLAAPIIIHTGKPVMALGGFSGRDPALTHEDFARLVEEGQIRFVLIGGRGSFGRSRDSEARGQAIKALAFRIGKPVDPVHWRSTSRRSERMDEAEKPIRRAGYRMQLYDLRPTADLFEPRVD